MKNPLNPKGDTMLVKVTRMDNGNSEVINLTEVSTVQPVAAVDAQPAFDGTARTTRYSASPRNSSGA